MSYQHLVPYTIAGHAYYLNFSIEASERIGELLGGGMELLDPYLRGTDDKPVSNVELAARCATLLQILIEQGEKYQQIYAGFTGLEHEAQRVPTVEELKLLLTYGEAIDAMQSIQEAVMKGAAITVTGEAAEPAKNAGAVETETSDA